MKGDRSKILLVLLFQPLLGVADEQAMGRFFFTPEQRARMDVVRQQERGARAGGDQQENEFSAARVMLNGIVSRSDGKGAVWINNRLENELGPRSGVIIQSKGRQVDIQVRDGHASVPLKVGQSVDMASGLVEEAYRKTPFRGSPDNNENSLLKSRLRNSEVQKNPDAADVLGGVEDQPQPEPCYPER